MEVTGSKKKKFKMCEAASLTDLDSPKVDSTQGHKHRNSNHPDSMNSPKQNQVGTVMLFGVPIVSLIMDGKERLCLAQISSTLLKEFSYNEIHNRRVALGITCIQCTPVQLEILRRAGAMPVTSRRCGMITRREAERLCQSFLGDHAPPQLPENFAFDVYHECAWGCRGAFVPSRYNSSRAKCIRCSFCQLFFSPNKFIFHSHRLPESRYVQPDAANFNSWRRHLKLCGDPPDEVSDSPYPNHSSSRAECEASLKSKESLVPTITSSLMATAQIVHAWEDVKAMFNGGTRKRLLAAHSAPTMRQQQQQQHQHRPPSNSPQKNVVVVIPSSASSSPCSSNPTTSSISPRAVTPQTSRAGGQQQHYGHSSDLTSASSPSFMTGTTPLLSPSSRLDTIWNPGISSAAAAAAAAAAVARQCQLNPSAAAAAAAAATPALPPLPFHPLSIPWLRRPLFPFSHPFGPTCKLFGENGNGILPSDGLLASSLPFTGPSGRHQNPSPAAMNSAFKPVSSRGSEQFFSWLNNNNNIHHHGTPLHPTLPEDLSVASTCPELNVENPAIHPLHKPTSLAYNNNNNSNNNNNNNNNHSPSHLLPLIPQDPTKSMLINPLHPDIITPPHSQESHKKFSGQVPTMDENPRPITTNNNHNHGSSGSINDEDSDDEENVDIESTEMDRDNCGFSPHNSNSYPLTNWMNSTSNVQPHSPPVNHPNNNSASRRFKLSAPVSSSSSSSNNNNENEDAPHGCENPAQRANKNLIGSGNAKKKRLWDCGRRMVKSSPTTSHYVIKESKQQHQQGSSSSGGSNAANSRSNSATPELIQLVGSSSSSSNNNNKESGVADGFNGK